MILKSKRSLLIIGLTLTIIASFGILAIIFVDDSVLADTNKKISKYLGTDTKKERIITQTTSEILALTQRRKKTKTVNYLPEVKDIPIITPEMELELKRWEGQAPTSDYSGIEIDLSTQRLLVWEIGQLKYNFLASTGKPKTPTVRGVFQVLTKQDMAYGAGDGQQWAMPYWLGFYRAGGTENGIHALPYIDGYKESSWDLGHPISHGCVRVSDANAVLLYNWAQVGTWVIVHR